MADTGRHDQCKACPGQGNELFSTIEQVRVVCDVAVDVAHRGEGKQDAPVIRLVNQVWRDIFESAQAKIWRPIQTVDHLIRKVVVEHEM